MNDHDDTPDLHKLRRFALSIGLVLITYSVAGVKFVPNETIRPLGLPLEISDPGLVPIGLVLASVYSATRFFYYGVLLSNTPLRIRANQWRLTKDALFTTTIGGEQLNSYINKLDSLYPRGFQLSPIFTSDSKKISLARHRRLLASLHDIDYWAPIWFNIVALLVFSGPTLRGSLVNG